MAEIHMIGQKYFMLFLRPLGETEDLHLFLFVNFKQIISAATSLLCLITRLTLYVSRQSCQALVIVLGLVNLRYSSKLR